MFPVSELCGLSEADPAADWWSLGAILFEILTGKVHQHLNAELDTFGS